MKKLLILFTLIAFAFPLTGESADNSIAGAKYDPSNRSQVPYRTTDDGSGHQSLHVVVDSGGGGGAVTIAEGADETQGAKTDAKSSATDTTSVSIVSILKQISASVQAPPAQAVTGPLTDAQLRATAVPVSAAQKQLTGAPSSSAILTADGTVFTLAAGEKGFIQNLSADAPLAVKYGSGASTTSFNFILRADTAQSSGNGGAKEINDYVGVVSVAVMTGTGSYVASKRAP